MIEKLYREEQRLLCMLVENIHEKEYVDILKRQIGRINDNMSLVAD